MKALNIIIYVFLGFGIFWLMYYCKKEKKSIDGYKKYGYLGVILIMVNTISFGMTFVSSPQEIYVEKSGYGEEEKSIPLLLETENQEKEIEFTVSARRFTAKELEDRVKEAFLYLEEHIKGDNGSLLEVRNALDYSLDETRFPFDIEFVSDDYALIDDTGEVKNDKEYLLSLGFTEREITQGIPITLTVILWYEEESFRQEFSLKVFPKYEGELEQQFAQVKENLLEQERSAAHEEGFYIPTEVDGVTINRLDQEGITPVKVLIMGIILVVLLFLREKENERKEKENRIDCLKRSYPWFVNEMVLLLGAGMQVRNILAMIVGEYQTRRKKEDYRDILIEEIGAAVRAMDLGMSEEQAYYQLGRRLGIPSYVKLMTLLEQNVKRGGKGLISFFEQEELLALEERKNLAKRYGEEAGTKLLGPMILLLLIVMLMIVLPAFMGFA